MSSYKSRKSQKTHKSFFSFFLLSSERFLYLLVLSFFFLASCSLVLAKNTTALRSAVVKQTAGKIDKINKNDQLGNFPQLPVLNPAAVVPEFTAEAILAQDIDSGVFLYQKNVDKVMLPASTTKIMTALVALEYFPSDYVFTVGKIEVEGQKMKLVPGEQITLTNLLYGLLIYSANDAAEALAQSFPGGREAFIEAMNKKARELGLNNTHFTNPVGLDDFAHYSSAYDLVAVSMVAMENPDFSRIVGTEKMTAASIDGKVIHKLANINQLLGTVDGVLGIKTGWTENAHENLITEVSRSGHKIIIAVLGSEDRFGESKSLIEWIYGNYEWKDVKY